MKSRLSLLALSIVGIAALSACTSTLPTDTAESSAPTADDQPAAANISSRNLEVMETLFAAAVWYMIIVTVASIGQFYLERAFDGSTRRGRPRNLRTAIRNALVRPPFSRRGIDE
ncbi:hypothetical protein [Brachybacterium sp. AOP29-B2-41]|uniref:hypothetical protein n=1 Tax=Brachybacterium sp. AOP29-B2-41 TaxID=3457704 RepID=UPI004034E3F8